uniref:Holin n=1 Tax=viral metagenome TaxID=1070528 RepID=A0A6M3XGJ1_9ZZZZ
MIFLSNRGLEGITVADPSIMSDPGMIQSLVSGLAGSSPVGAAVFWLLYRVKKLEDSKPVPSKVHENHQAVCGRTFDDLKTGQKEQVAMLSEIQRSLGRLEGRGNGKGDGK